MTARTKRARDAANARWNGGSEIADIQRNRYQPLNPETFNQPAPAPLPFTSVNPKVREWAHARQLREAAEACKAIVPVSEPVTVRADLPVYQTAHFKVLFVEHWAECRMCYEVQNEHGDHIGTYFDGEVAMRRADECEAFRAYMASLPEPRLPLPGCPF